MIYSRMMVFHKRKEAKAASSSQIKSRALDQGKTGPITSIPKAMGVMGLARGTDANRERSFDGMNESCGSTASNGLETGTLIAGPVPSVEAIISLGQLASYRFLVGILGSNNQ